MIKKQKIPIHARLGFRIRNSDLSLSGCFEFRHSDFGLLIRDYREEQWMKKR